MIATFAIEKAAKRVERFARRVRRTLKARRIGLTYGMGPKRLEQVMREEWNRPDDPSDVRPMGYGHYRHQTECDS